MGNYSAEAGLLHACSFSVTADKSPWFVVGVAKCLENKNWFLSGIEHMCGSTDKFVSTKLDEVSYVAVRMDF